MPLVVRPDPPPPMSVSVATKVFGSEILVALIRYYRASPGTQRSAAAALNIPHQLVSTNTRTLIDAGVVIEKEAARGSRGGTYAVDDDRTWELARALISYALDQESAPDS